MVIHLGRKLPHCIEQPQQEANLSPTVCRLSSRPCAGSQINTAVNDTGRTVCKLKAATVSTVIAMLVRPTPSGTGPN